MNNKSVQARLRFVATASGGLSRPEAGAADWKSAAPNAGWKPRLEACAPSPHYGPQASCLLRTGAPSMSHEIKRFVLVESNQQRAWEALTKDSELAKWFCLQAEVDLERGIYQLNSRVPHASGKHRIKRVEEHRLLEFEWMIAGYPSDAVLQLEEFKGLTRITVRHAVADDFPALEEITDSMGAKAAHLDYLWCYAFLLLKSYLRESHAEFQLKEKEDPLNIEWQTTIAAPAPEVFRALTEPEQIRKWNPYSGDVRVEPFTGGRYSFGWGTEEKGTDGPDRIVEFKQDQSVSYSWHGQDPKTVVTWTTEPVEAGRTRLHFKHSGFTGNPKMVLEYKLGWAHFMYGIKMSLETQQSMNDWNGSSN